MSTGRLPLTWSDTMFRALPQCNGLPVTVDLNAGDFPTAGDDVIPGTVLGDTINASSGNYTTCSEAGDDDLDGGASSGGECNGQSGSDTATANCEVISTVP